jgi:diadenosine tetraphosphate (Ap4A) HIT family hydrolase
MAPCALCEENDRQAAGELAEAVAELQTGFVRLHRIQRYRGAAFFVARDCVREVYHLDPTTRAAHLDELAEVCSALDAVFLPTKLNIESLGNGVPHLHWWLTPRHADDPRPRSPIWENLDFLREMWTGSGHAESEALVADAGLLRSELSRRGLLRP